MNHNHAPSHRREQRIPRILSSQESYPYLCRLHPCPHHDAQRSKRCWQKRRVWILKRTRTSEHHDCPLAKKQKRCQSWRIQKTLSIPCYGHGRATRCHSSQCRVKYQLQSHTLYPQDSEPLPRHQRSIQRIWASTLCAKCHDHEECKRIAPTTAETYRRCRPDSRSSA